MRCKEHLAVTGQYHEKPIQCLKIHIREKKNGPVSIFMYGKYHLRLNISSYALSLDEYEGNWRIMTRLWINFSFAFIEPKKNIVGLFNEQLLHNKKQPMQCIQPKNCNKTARCVDMNHLHFSGR